MSILDELQWRGLLNDCTAFDDLVNRLAEGPITLYAGFDPTADSLHVGNLVPLLALRRFQVHGHRPIALAGGATGSIGDPSGKKSERQLLNKETLDHNIEQVKQQLTRLIDFDTATPNAAKLVDNASWTAPITFLEFLRDVGKHFTINAMVAKESVRARMHDQGGGISYTEFSYMLLQGYDFFYLNQHERCELQIGGSDQWGNITVGTELTRKKAEATVFGLTLPLITNADGSKFGKSAEGAIWLNPARTSIYQFYQFWVNVDDRDVIRYLKYFTFLDREAIADLESQHSEKPHERIAHRALALEMTQLIHGTDATAGVIAASEVLFGGDPTRVSAQGFADVVAEIPNTATIQRRSLSESGIGLLEALVDCGLCPSRGQARKDVQGGGVYVNQARIDDSNAQLTEGDIIHQRFILLRRGKKNYGYLIVAE